MALRPSLAAVYHHCRDLMKMPLNRNTSDLMNVAITDKIENWFHWESSFDNLHLNLRPDALRL